MASEEFKRGQRIISANEAATRAKRLLPLDDFGLTWGGLVLPSTEATTHFCVVGATGSGKTTLLRLLMQSCLPLIGATYKEKSYDTNHVEIEQPSAQEWEEYNSALASHEAAVAARSAAIEENRVAVEAIRSENRRITFVNQSHQNFKRRKEQKIVQLEREIEGVRYSEESTLSIKVAMGAIPVVVFLSPLLFELVPSITWEVQIVVQILLGLSFLGLLFLLAGNSARRNKHNDEVRMHCEFLRQDLQKEKNQLATFRETEESTPIAEPARLTLPPVPPLTITRPLAKSSVVNEVVNPNVYAGPGHRAMIYDAKGDTISLLHGMQLKRPIRILNPFDVRATAWDIARDFTTPASARQFATILIPEDKNASQPFFANSARDLIGQIIISLIQLKPGEWTLRDLILATQSKEKMIALLEKTPQGAAKANTYFSDDRTGNNILSEIATRMAPFESVAQAWRYADDRTSLTEWVSGESILVLGSNEEHRAALEPINRVLFQRATELALAQDESDARRTWFFLDEVRDLGNLESLGRLMTKGRSKGVCVVLGFQDIEGMHDAFGKERANEFIGQCANKAVLRLNSPETAKWASELFGKYEFFEEETGKNKGGSTTSGSTKTTGETTGETETMGTSKGVSMGTSKGFSSSEGTSWGSSNSTSGSNSSSSSQRGGQEGSQRSEQRSEQTSDQSSESLAKQKSMQSSIAENASDTESWTETINKKRMEKDALLPSQFMTLPVTNPRNGLHGYYLLPAIGAFYGVLDSAYVKGSLLPPDDNEPNYVPRPPSHQYLQAWTDAELKALHLKQRTRGEQSNRGDKDKTTSLSGGGNAESERKLPNIKRWLPGSDRDTGLTRL